MNFDDFPSIDNIEDTALSGSVIMHIKNQVISYLLLVSVLSSIKK